MDVLLALLVLIAAILVLWIGLRVTARWSPRPCPTYLIGLLDNPFTAGYHRTILSRLELTPGLSVLDAGCGPGLLSIPIAHAVGEQGMVLGLDLQAGMIQKAREAAAADGLTNISFIVAALGEGALPSEAFDRALLVTVLGEIPQHQRLAVLREIHAGLRPGGFLSITEVLLDPDYQPREKARSLALETGFQVRNEFGNSFVFTLNLEKPPLDEGGSSSEKHKR